MRSPTLHGLAEGPSTVRDKCTPPTLTLLHLFSCRSRTNCSQQCVEASLVTLTLYRRWWGRPVVSSFQRLELL